MRRAGLLYMLAGVLTLVAFFLPASGTSLWDIVRGVGAAHRRLAVLDFLPLNVALRLVQIVIVMIAIMGLHFVLFGLGLARGVDNTDRPLVSLAGWIELVTPVLFVVMSWPAHPSPPEIVFFAAGATAVGASILADRSAQASPS